MFCSFFFSNTFNLANIIDIGSWTSSLSRLCVFLCVFPSVTKGSFPILSSRSGLFFSHRESAIQFKTADGMMAFIRIWDEEPWHADVYDFLELRKNHGKEEQRARCFCYGAYWQEMWCWCGGWTVMKRWDALGIVVAGLLRCHSFCEYCVSFWRNRTWRRTWDLINFYPWYRHQKWRRHLSWCVVGFVVSVVLEAPIFWKSPNKTADTWCRSCTPNPLSPRDLFFGLWVPDLFMKRASVLIF